MMFAIEHLINHEKKLSCVQPLHLRAGAWIVELAEVLFRHDRTDQTWPFRVCPELALHYTSDINTVKLHVLDFTCL
jgi:hypothetical protein